MNITEDSLPSSINIKSGESVNGHQDETARIEWSPENMLAVIDLIFGFTPESYPPS